MQGVDVPDDVGGDVVQRRRKVVVADRLQAAVHAEMADELGDAHGGSAKLPSVARHECAICGHGHDAAPHDPSAVVGVFQRTT